MLTLKRITRLYEFVERCDHTTERVYLKDLEILARRIESAEAWLDAVAEVSANPQGVPKTSEWYYETVEKVRQIVRSSGR